MDSVLFCQRLGGAYPPPPPPRVGGLPPRLLEGLTEQEDLDKVGGWILECGSADELLSRVSGLLAERRG